MPPVAALVISFGSLPMSDAQTNAMSVFDHHLGDYLTQTGLFSISAIEPEHGFLLFLHNVIHKSLSLAKLSYDCLFFFAIQ